MKESPYHPILDSPLAGTPAGPRGPACATPRVTPGSRPTAGRRAACSRRSRRRVDEKCCHCRLVQSQPERPPLAVVALDHDEKGCRRWPPAALALAARSLQRVSGRPPPVPVVAHEEESCRRRRWVLVGWPPSSPPIVALGEEKGCQLTTPLLAPPPIAIAVPS
jgi:hypothetical protein